MKKQTKKESKKFNIKENKKMQLIIGLVAILILLLGATYAYFAITSVNNATTTTITGTGEELGTPTLTTNTTSLSLNLTAEMMDQNKDEIRYFASPDGNAISVSEVITDSNHTYGSYRLLPAETGATLGNGKYEFATISLDAGVPYDCTYTFDISATTTKDLGDDGKNVYVILTNPDGNEVTYTLDDLLKGVVYMGKSLLLKAGEDQKIYIESYVDNTDQN